MSDLTEIHYKTTPSKFCEFSENRRNLGNIFHSGVKEMNMPVPSDHVTFENRKVFVHCACYVRDYAS